MQDKNWAKKKKQFLDVLSVYYRSKWIYAWERSSVENSMQRDCRFVACITFIEKPEEHSERVN